MRKNKVKYLLIISVIFLSILFEIKNMSYASVIKVMTFNTWCGFANIKNGFEKGVKVIKESKVDIVGLQESASVAEDVAKQLNWYVAHDFGNGVAIISKYQILKRYFNNAWAVGTLIKVNDSSIKKIYIWNCHLSSSPYGVSYAHQGYPIKEILDKEEVRVFEIKDIVSDIKDQLNNSDNIPVILMGDFNCPSHLDWIKKTKNSHYGYVIKWPVSLILEKVGMKDSFRLIYPDPSINPGNTWSPIYKIDEPQDRIDRIYFKGNKLKVIDSYIYTGYGKTSTDPNYVDNDWPSDHAAVITVFKLN